MTIYFGMLAISLFFAVYAQRARPLPQIRESYVAFCILAALPFIAITVFRYRVGTDYAYIYENGYALLKRGVESFPDPGFNLIFRLFGRFTDDAWWAISFVGLLTMIFFFAAFCQQSASIPLSILAFFLCGAFFQSLSAIRQGLAMSIFLYSVKHLRARDWRRYFLLNLIGATLHASSLMYLPLYFLYGVRATPRRCLTILGIAILGYPLLGALLRLAAQLIPRFSRYFGGIEDASDIYWRSFLTTLCFALLQIFYLARFPQRDKDFEWMTYMMLIAAGFLLYSAKLPSAQRAAEAASIVQVFSFPRMLRKETDDRMRALVGASVFGLLAVRLVVFEIYLSRMLDPVPWYGVIPYRWVFFR